MSIQSHTAGDLDKGTVRRAYAGWAPVYDLVFGAVFASARKRAIAAVNRRGGRVLELGVGTGIALPHYRPDSRVVGVDYSEDMLRRAQAKRRERNMPHVEGLVLMDGARLGFADATFDTVVAMFLITVVPDPEEVLAEARRVLRPGGELVLVNHFAAEGDGWRARIERYAAPRTRKLGWRPDFPTARVTATPGLRLIERTSVGAGGFTLLRLQVA